MKKIIIGLSVVLVITFAVLFAFLFTDQDTNACQKQVQKELQQLPKGPADSTWLLCEGHVGKIEINMNAAKLETLFGKEKIEEKMNQFIADKPAKVARAKARKVRQKETKAKKAEAKTEETK